MNKKCVLFCGPSGSGKTTIVHHLLKNNSKLSFSVSATTRHKRYTETDGIDYYFLTVDEFKARIARKEFLEWEEVYKDRFYGTMQAEVERIWKNGKAVLFDVDVEGGLNIKKKLQKNILTIFVQPPSLEELHRRLSLRKTETPESLQARIEKSEAEMKYGHRFDKIIINDNLENAQAQAEKLVKDFLKSK
jgi:guanylate kinase